MNCVEYGRKKGKAREPMRYTKHAQKRLQQRAIPELSVKVIRRYGKRGYHKGAEVYRINKKSRHRLKEYLKAHMSKQEYRRVIECLECYVVVSDGDVITAGHRTTRLKFN